MKIMLCFETNKRFAKKKTPPNVFIKESEEKHMSLTSSLSILTKNERFVKDIIIYLFFRSFLDQ